MWSSAPIARAYAETQFMTESTSRMGWFLDPTITEPDLLWEIRFCFWKAFPIQFLLSNQWITFKKVLSKIRISQLSAVVLPRTKMNSINKLDPLCAHISQKDIHVGICEAYARVFPSPTHLAVGCKHCESQAKKIISETASRSVADAVYSARYQSQCWFVSYWLHSTCDSRYGRQ